MQTPSAALRAQLKEPLKRGSSAQIFSPVGCFTESSGDLDPWRRTGPPHLWLQRGKPRETVLIHHRCHDLKLRKEGVRARSALLPHPSVVFPKIPSFLTPWICSRGYLVPEVEGKRERPQQ